MLDTHVTQNYSTDNGNELVINGKLTIGESATVTGGGFNQLAPATASTLGGIKVGSGLSITDEGVLSVNAITPAANQASSTAGSYSALREDFNTLLSALKAAGLMEADTETGI